MSLDYHTIQVVDFSHGNNAVSSDDGEILFREIDKKIKEGFGVELDFSGIAVITTAFLNSAIGQLYGEYNSEKLNQSIRFSNVSSEDRILFVKVVTRAKEYFANRKGFEDSASNAIYDS